MRRILHVGCGGATLPPWLLPAEETRLDIDDKHKPDIVASILDMSPVPDCTFDGVFTSHTLEHVYPHEVPVALAECRRVLKDGGSLILMVPNLENVRPTEDVIYVSPAGPVTGLDMIYGARWLLKDMPYMAHHTGFIPSTLYAALEATGFTTVGVRVVAEWNLMGVGIR